MREFPQAATGGARCHGPDITTRYYARSKTSVADVLSEGFSADRPQEKSPQTRSDLHIASKSPGT